MAAGKSRPRRCLPALHPPQRRAVYPMLARRIKQYQGDYRRFSRSSSQPRRRYFVGLCGLLVGERFLFLPQRTCGWKGTDRGVLAGFAVTSGDHRVLKLFVVGRLAVHTGPAAGQ